MWMALLSLWSVSGDAQASPTGPLRGPGSVLIPRPRRPVPPPMRRACAPAELRVSSMSDGWYDLYVDGQLRAEARQQRDQRAIAVSAGRRHLRVTSHTGQPYATETLTVGCGEVLVVDVGSAGIQILNRWGESPPTPVRVGPPPGPCASGSMTFLPASGSAFFDVFIDGAKRIEHRVDTNARVALHPGRYQVTITGIGGDVWSSTYVDLGCGQDWTGRVETSRDLQ